MIVSSGLQHDEVGEAPMNRPNVGLLLAPDPEWLRGCTPLFELVDYFSVTPETLWRGAELAPNGYWRAFAALQQDLGCPMVAHSVGVSLGSAGGEARRKRWLQAMARDQRTFQYHWWTDHLSLTTAAGENLTLPLPLPFTAAAAGRIRERLEQMAEVVPVVGVENSAQLFLPGPALAEPGWITSAIGPHRLLLDLYNLHLMSQNFQFSASDWLERAPLEQVIEIHLAGGQFAPAHWKVAPMLLDGHDAAVPEAVWSLLEQVLPRCPGLKGVTLERMEGTVLQERDRRQVAEELQRIRTALVGWRPVRVPARSTDFVVGEEKDLAEWEDFLVSCLRVDASDPQDGQRAAALLIARHRFERLLFGSPEATHFFEEKPAEFAAAFRQYHRQTPATAFFPAEEAALWQQFFEKNATL